MTYLLCGWDLGWFWKHGALFPFTPAPSSMPTFSLALVPED